MIFLVDVGTGQPIRKFRGHISVSWPVCGRSELTLHGNNNDAVVN